MKENRVKLEDPCDDKMYRAWYRCSNCGTIFQYDMPLGKLASQMDGICPVCAIKSGTPNAGTFPIIKYNPEHDQVRHYYK